MMDTDWQQFVFYFDLLLLVLVPVLAFFTIQLWPLPKPDTFNSFKVRVYRESPWRFIFIVFCFGFGFFSLMDEIFRQLGMYGFDSSLKYLMATYVTEAELVIAWQVSRKAKRPGDEIESGAVSK